MSNHPRVMLAGPSSTFWEPVRIYLEQAARDGSFSLEAWDTERHLGSTGDILHWREKTRNVDAIIFLFGSVKKGKQSIVNAGTLMNAGQIVRGQCLTYNTTATEQEYLHCFLRPVPHLFLLPSEPQISDPIIERMRQWGHQALGTTVTHYTGFSDASREARKFIGNVIKNTSERLRFSVQPVPGLGMPDEHSIGIRDPSIALANAPHHVRVALDELAISFAARRQDSSDLLKNAGVAATSRALSLCLLPPGSSSETFTDFFTRLSGWTKHGPKFEGLLGAPNFAECFFKSLSAWEKTVFLLAAGEAALIHRYHRKHAEELHIHEIICASARDILEIPPGTTSSEARNILTWAIVRWKEIFIAAAVYAGHPEIIESSEIIKSVLRIDWADDISATFEYVDNLRILSEPSGNWKIRLKQLQGVVCAAKGQLSRAAEYLN